MSASGCRRRARRWHYSNTNYLLLGLIAERVTGQTLAQAIRARLLEPAGLGETWYQAAEAARTPLAHGYRFVGTKLTAKPIDLADGSGIAPFRSVVTAAAGAGSMAGTSGDLARWGRALYGGAVLGPQGTALLLSRFTKTTRLPARRRLRVRRAGRLDRRPPEPRPQRPAARVPVGCAPLPARPLTIAVLTNQSRADPGLIVRALLKLALRPRRRACAGSARRVSLPAGTADPAWPGRRPTRTVPMGTSRRSAARAD